jgi:hypothetical protein
MNLHLAEISLNVAPGAHALVLMDQAGWHLTPKLDLPSNISIVAIPSKSPELNPQENVWQFMRDNWLSNRVFGSYDENRRPLLRRLEQARRTTLEDHVTRPPPMGARVLISESWYKSMSLALPPIMLIPAIRAVGPKGAPFEDYSGTGLIDKLASLQNPSHDRRIDRDRFDKINEFLKTVTDRADAEIEVPYNREHIMVHMDGRVLPLSSLGTGIHEVVMIAAFCTISEDCVVCIEEPEIHLHPLLQRKLMSYLADNTTNQYFIATHSAAFIDTPGAAIFHVRLDEAGKTFVSEAILRQARYAICVDLGHRASDIIQANSVIWVEGPSDRTYLNYWINAYDPALKEGIDYSIMFYGGRLLSHLAADDAEVSEFIQLRNLNRNVAILMDSDKRSAYAKINDTKKRLMTEFSVGGLAWVTKGREIENYIEHSELQKGVKSVYGPTYGKALCGGMYDHALHFERAVPKKTRSKPPTTDLTEREVDKVKVSKAVVDSTAANLDVLDLRERISEVIELIRRSNV